MRLEIIDLRLDSVDTSSIERVRETPTAFFANPKFIDGITLALPGLGKIRTGFTHYARQ